MTTQPTQNLKTIRLWVFLTCMLPNLPICIQCETSTHTWTLINPPFKYESLPHCKLSLSLACPWVINGDSQWQTTWNLIIYLIYVYVCVSGQIWTKVWLWLSQQPIIYFYGDVLTLFIYSNNHKGGKLNDMGRYEEKSPLVL